MKKTLKGFTLIEMLIVIVIIGILAAVLLPKIGGARDKAEDVAVTATVKNLGAAIIQYDMDNNKYPDNYSGTDGGLNIFWNSQSLMDKYGLSKPSDTNKFFYKSITTPAKHFVVCGKYSESNNAGNRNYTGSGTTSAEVLGDWTSNNQLTGQGNYFCYEG